MAWRGTNSLPGRCSVPAIMWRSGRSCRSIRSGLRSGWSNSRSPGWHTSCHRSTSHGRTGTRGHASRWNTASRDDFLDGRVAMAIEHVSDTARWVAVYRAMETERPDASFKDPFARRLAGERGQAIVDEIKQGRSMAWAMITRTAVFDEMILDLIKRENVDLVVNLACGLDARAWRLDVPRKLRWVDVDFPVMIDYKTEILKNERPVCRYEAIAVDLTDDGARSALFARLGAGAQRVLVISEGLLIYLTPEQVSTLARDLHAQSSFRWWLIDLAHPQSLKMMTKMWGGSVPGGHPPFPFAPEEGTGFSLPLGWRETSFRSQGNEARRLHREMRGMWIWRWMSIFYPKKQREIWRRFAGYVMFERT